VANFAYNQNSYFTSSAPIDGIPTAWGIYKVASGALQASNQSDNKIDELKLLVQDLGKTVGDLKSEISLLKSEVGVMRSELDSLERGMLTVRIRQEKSLLTLGVRTLNVATIIAGRVAADELAKLGAVRPNFKIPIKNDPFGAAPELE
jgi:hypothetical protein